MKIIQCSIGKLARTFRRRRQESGRERRAAAALQAQSTQGESSRGEGGEGAISEAMEGLTLNETDTRSTASSGTSERKYTFGSSDDFTFDFKPPSTIKDWPGPPYDEHARFAPGVFDKARPTRPRAKLRTPKRKLSQQDSNVPKRSTKGPRDGDIVKTKTVARRPIQYYGTPPPRDLPLHLLNLPGEIRNQIYKLVCVSSEPLIAQFKPIMLPRRGHDNAKRIVVRRFPREPVLALGNTQLRDEVLSIFYGANKFVIRQTDHLELKAESLFGMERLIKWTPKWDVATCLTHMEVQYTARLPGGGKESINYVVRYDAEKEVTVTLRTEIKDHCVCFDEGVREQMRLRLADRSKVEANLVGEVQKFMAFRDELLEGDEGLVRNGSKFRPKGLTCAVCEKEHLRVLENGQ